MRTMRGLGRSGSLFSAAAACALACGLVAIPGVAHAADAETVTLPGDLLVNGDTQDTQAYTVSRGGCPHLHGPSRRHGGVQADQSGRRSV